MRLQNKRRLEVWCRCSDSSGVTAVVVALVEDQLHSRQDAQLGKLARDPDARTNYNSWEFYNEEWGLATIGILGIFLDLPVHRKELSKAQ